MKQWIIGVFFIVQVVHATILEDLVNVAAKQMQDPEPEQNKIIIIKTKEQAHPIYTLAHYFGQGAAVTAVGALPIFLLGLTNEDAINAVKREYAAKVVAAGGIPCLMYYVLQALDRSVSGFKTGECPKCLQSVSRQERLNHWAQVAGSGSAIALIYVLIKSS